MIKKYHNFSGICLVKYFVILFLLVFDLTVSARTYYVKNGGNDSNSGLSDKQAWAHHPWMTTWTGKTKLIAGDTIRMKCGDSWIIATTSSPFITVEQSGFVNLPIITTSYGIGTKPRIAITGDSDYPVIHGSNKSYITFDNLEIHHWSSIIDKQSSQCGIQFGRSGNAVPHDWLITNCSIHDCPKTGISGYTDSYNITIGDTLASSCATNVSFSNHIYNCGYAGILLGGCDPVSLNSHFNIYYNYIHDININGDADISSYGVAVTAASSSSGFPCYVKMRFNYVANIPVWEGLDAHGGRYIYFQDNYVYNCHSGIATQLADAGSLTPILDHCIIERNIIENPGDDAFGNHYFIQMQGSGTDYSANSVIRDNTLFYTTRPKDESSAYGIKVVCSDGVIIERNLIFNGPPGQCQGAIKIGRVKNSVIRNNLILNWYGGIYLGHDNIEGSFSIYNNIIYNSGGAGNPFHVYNSVLKGDVKLFNNVILTSSVATDPCSIDFLRATISEGASLIIRNNIIGFTSNTFKGIYFRSPKENYGALKIDYNLYWNSIKRNPFIWMDHIGTG